MRIDKVVSATIAILSGASLCVGSLPASGYQTAQTVPATKEETKNEVQTGNLLVNSGLEAGAGTTPDGWQTGRPVPGVIYSWDTSVGYESTHSLCLTKSENRYFPIAEWKQTVALKDGTKHVTVSAYVRAKDLGKAVLDVQFLSADGKVLLGADGKVLFHHWASYIGPDKVGDPLLNHNWKRYSGTVEIPDGTTQIVIAPQIYGPGTVWFDDITAVAAP